MVAFFYLFISLQDPQFTWYFMSLIPKIAVLFVRGEYSLLIEVGY